MIIVANKRKPTYQGPSGFDPSYLYIGRPSPLGNPFKIGEDGTRDEVVDKYRTWLRGQYKSDPDVGLVIDRIVYHHKAGTTVTLVCWCAPARCHGDEIKALVEELARE